MLRKLSLLALSLLVLPFMLGVSSCEQKLDAAYGLHAVKQPDGSFKVTADPTGGPVGSGVELATQVASNVPGPGTIIASVLATLFGAGSLAQTVLKKRLQASLDEEQAAHADTKTALSATTSGIVSFAKSNPAVAQQLVDHIDDSHDAHDVAPALQDKVQSAIPVPTAPAVAPAT